MRTTLIHGTTEFASPSYFWFGRNSLVFRETKVRNSFLQGNIALVLLKGYRRLHVLREIMGVHLVPRASLALYWYSHTARAGTSYATNS